MSVSRGDIVLVDQFLLASRNNSVLIFQWPYRLPLRRCRPDQFGWELPQAEDLVLAARCERRAVGGEDRRVDAGLVRERQFALAAGDVPEGGGSVPVRCRQQTAVGREPNAQQVARGRSLLAGERIHKQAVAKVVEIDPAYGQVRGL